MTATQQDSVAVLRVSEIEDAIAAGKMTAAQVFTQMRQLLQPQQVASADRGEAVYTLAMIEDAWNVSVPLLGDYCERFKSALVEMSQVSDVPMIGNPLLVGLRNPIICDDASLEVALREIAAERESAESASEIASLRTTLEMTQAAAEWLSNELARLRAESAEGVPVWVLAAINSADEMLAEHGYAHTNLRAVRDWLTERAHSYEWFDAVANTWKPINRLPHEWEREVGIQWRTALSAAPSGVSDAMVERACRAHWDWWDEHGNTDIKKALTRQMRAALEAAQPQPGRVEGM